MKIISTQIPEVLLIEPTVFVDDRGFLFESFNERRFRDILGRDIAFVQENQSYSRKNVLRGLHYQIQRPQAKLVRITQGAVFDVAVDLRKSAATFGQWVGEILSAENKRQMWVPEGFAHGFLVLSDTAECIYKTTDYWAPEFEQNLVWNDATISVQWPLQGDPVLSEKDRQAKALQEVGIFA
ncbi:MAG: dTDP-4-dehydrorhamnose 3,5-epimerase [Rugosibacter sp.]|nr:MAG: dTDP-4-dehydrorhamnose 3,5-epimerase [Rugosibacter sp.]TBR07405.1 MAG: dTDP-4-dehydrorhamnose 3,5-epimerase [Rugosibacter sp.]